MLVVGAINVDLVVKVPELPRAGETVVGDGLTSHGGGKGANAAVAAARIGAVVRLVGAVGDDDFGAKALAELTAEAVGISDVAVVPEATGVALICVGPDGENQIAVAPGANMILQRDHIRQAIRAAEEIVGCVVVSTEISSQAVVAAVETARDLGIPCILNPAPVTAEVVTVLSRGPVVTPNAHECAALAIALRGTSSGTAASPGSSAEVDGVDADLVSDARLIQSRTGAPVVVTLGKGGVLTVTADGRAKRSPAVPTAVVDTTGAGDTFNGVLGVRLAAGDTVSEAVRVAAAAASLSVRRPGARGGMPTAGALEELLERPTGGSAPRSREEIR